MNIQASSQAPGATADFASAVTPNENADAPAGAVTASFVLSEMVSIATRAEVIERFQEVWDKVYPGVVDELASEIPSEAGEQSQEFAKKLEQALLAHGRIKHYVNGQRHIFDKVNADLMDRDWKKKKLYVGGAVCGECIGKGGFGETYEAVMDGKRVIVKILHPIAGNDANMKAAKRRFKIEIATMRDIEGDVGIPKILGSGEIPSTQEMYYIMERVEGKDLNHAFNEAAPENRRQLVHDTAVQASAILNHVHSNKVTHRDLKPANLMRDKQGKLWVIDFGLVKDEVEKEVEGITKPHQIIGSPHYMAPEQISREVPVDTPTDLYALACVLHEGFTGAPPYKGNQFQILNAHLSAEPDMSAYADDPELMESMKKMFQKEPSKRGDMKSVGEYHFKKSSFFTGNGGVFTSFAEFMDAPHSRRIPGVPSRPVEAKKEVPLQRKSLSKKAKLGWGVAALATATALTVAMILSRGKKDDDTKKGEDADPQNLVKNTKTGFPDKKEDVKRKGKDNNGTAVEKNIPKSFMQLTRDKDGKISNLALFDKDKFAIPGNELMPLYTIDGGKEEPMGAGFLLHRERIAQLLKINFEPGDLEDMEKIRKIFPSKLAVENPVRPGWFLEDRAKLARFMRVADIGIFLESGDDSGYYSDLEMLRNKRPSDGMKWKGPESDWVKDPLAWKFVSKLPPLVVNKNEKELNAPGWQGFPPANMLKTINRTQPVLQKSIPDPSVIRVVNVQK